MRFDQQKSACFRVARVAAVLGVLSASGSGVFASGQAPVTPPVAAPPASRPPAPAPLAGRAVAPAGHDHVADLVGRRGQDGAREQPRGSRRAVEPADPDLRGRPGARRLCAEPVLDHHEPQQHDPAGQLPHRHRRHADQRQPADQCRSAAAGAVGRRTLQPGLGRVEADDQRRVEPLQPAARLGPFGGVHAAAAPQLHHRQRAADRAPQPEHAAGRRHPAAPDDGPDVARGPQLPTTTW